MKSMSFEYKNSFNESLMKDLLPGTLVRVAAKSESDFTVKTKLNGKYGIVLKQGVFKTPDSIMLSKYALLVLIADKKYIVHCRDLEAVSE